MISMYALDVPPSQIRHIIRERFERNRDVDDMKVIDRLLHQSRVSYQEAMNGWLPSTSVKSILLQDKGRQQKTFLQSFFEGEFLMSCLFVREVDFGLKVGTGNKSLLHPQIYGEISCNAIIVKEKQQVPNDPSESTSSSAR